ncbi:MAG TPA: HAD family hydrolase [Candidatus Acidoferrum sp.]|nr:HAD family hydrolase [Candidatus Acidoferrum sp.]
MLPSLPFSAIHPLRHSLSEAGTPAMPGAVPIRAITLDVGGTLLQPWPSVGHVYAEVAARHGLQISPKDLNRRFAAAWRAKKDFSHTQSGWSALVDQTFAGLVGTPPSRSFFPALYAAFSSPSAWRVYDDVLPCLEQWRRRGLKLGAISNWDDRLRPLFNNWAWPIGSTPSSSPLKSASPNPIPPFSSAPPTCSKPSRPPSSTWATAAWKTSTPPAPPVSRPSSSAATNRPAPTNKSPPWPMRFRACNGSN